MEHEVEVNNKVESSFGEGWGDKKERMLRYHTANMPVGVIVGTLHSRVREGMRQEEEERDLKQQALLATPRTQGLGLLSPAPQASVSTAVTPPPPPHEVMLRDSIPSTDSASGNPDLGLILTPESGSIGAGAAVSPRRPNSVPLSHRRRMSASKPTGLEEWVDSANAGEGGGFDFDAENDRSRSSSIAASEPGSSLSNPPSLLSMQPAAAAATASAGVIAASPGSSPNVDPVARKRFHLKMASSGSVSSGDGTATATASATGTDTVSISGGDRRDRADSTLSVTPITTTWTEINSEEARKSRE